MAVSNYRLERFLELIFPLLVMSVYMTIAGRGFPSLWPVAACAVYAVVQPFLRFFVFDRIRAVLFEAQQGALFFLGAAVVYGVTAFGIARAFC